MWLGFTTVVLIGCWVTDHFTIPKVILAAVGASLAFFLISNFGVRAGAHVYPLTWHGLIACYVAALPLLSQHSPEQPPVHIFAVWWLCVLCKKEWPITVCALAEHQTAGPVTTFGSR
jgi:hypothetical protein